MWSRIFGAPIDLPGGEKEQQKENKEKEKLEDEKLNNEIRKPSQSDIQSQGDRNSEVFKKNTSKIFSEKKSNGEIDKDETSDKKPLSISSRYKEVCTKFQPQFWRKDLCSNCFHKKKSHAKVIFFFKRNKT